MNDRDVSRCICYLEARQMNESNTTLYKICFICLSLSHLSQNFSEPRDVSRECKWPPWTNYILSGPFFPRQQSCSAESLLCLGKVSIEKQIQSPPSNTYHFNLSMNPSNQEETLPGPSYAGAEQNSKVCKRPKSVKPLADNLELISVRKTWNSEKACSQTSCGLNRKNHRCALVEYINSFILLCKWILQIDL